MKKGKKKQLSRNARAWPVIYTLGYERKDLISYVKILLDHGITKVVDVREHPWSQRPEYVKGPFSRVLSEHGIEYLHDKNLGNPKAIRNTARTREDALKMFDTYINSSEELLDGLKSVIRQARKTSERICLVCYENAPEECHRSVLLQTLRSQRIQFKVHHLGIEEKTC
jgi:uncharacterized protein (DUF488 family)